MGLEQGLDKTIAWYREFFARPTQGSPLARS
jgi:hypothetical protein